MPRSNSAISPSNFNEDRALWVVFVDTFELVNEVVSREAERDLQRLVIGLEDVLWVVTGSEPTGLGGRTP